MSGSVAASARSFPATSKAATPPRSPAFSRPAAGSPSRRVLPNRSAVSTVDARRYVEWEAKKALASVIQLDVTHDTWVAEPGDRVRIRAPLEGIDEDFVVASVTYTVGEAVEQKTTCVLPDVYSTRPLRPRVERRVERWEIATKEGLERANRLAKGEQP